MSEFLNYDKKKEYLVCVDSDGCAIDSMDIKHFRSFGPSMVDEWNLEEWKDEILKRWNEINLYTITRGINRFKGLLMALKEINEKYTEIMDLESLEEWTKTTNELSNNSVIREIEKKPDSIILKKALSWSNKVNASIKALPEEEILPFEMVKEALEFAHVRADVAIVSSANLGAVLDEWTRHNLIAHTDIVLAQNAGTKAYCIQELLKKGYDPNNVLMCGDALGDLEAANKNNVHFYPILVRNEKQSWTEFITIGFEKLLSNEYSGEYQEKKIQEFLSNLGGK
jgi:phosphoglycolate phosphatase-like HAD superfamily hydrolase